MSSYQELISQREKLDQQIETAKAAEFDAVVNDIKRKMQIYGITCADLGIQLGKSNKLRPRGRIGAAYAAGLFRAAQAFSSHSAPQAAGFAPGAFVRALLFLHLAPVYSRDDLNNPLRA